MECLSLKNAGKLKSELLLLSPDMHLHIGQSITYKGETYQITGIQNYGVWIEKGYGRNHSCLLITPDNLAMLT